MAIILREIRSTVDHVATALVEHGGRDLVALVSGEPDRLRAAIGTTLVVELDFGEVRSSRALPRDAPENHGLDPLPSGDIRVVGVVHKISPIPDEAPLVDVYLQSGPDFITFEADALSCALVVGCGIEVVVGGLSFFPTWP